MKENRSEIYKLIIDCLSTNYGIEVSELILLPLGADAHAEVYKAHASDDLSFFIKLKHNVDINIGFALSRMLYDAGIQQIISPIKTIHGQTTQRVGDFTIIVYPFIEGNNGFKGTLTDDQWCTLGKVLRKVHDFKVPPSIIDQVRRESFSPQWRMVVRSLHAHIESEPTGDLIALEFLKFMKKNWKTIERIVSRSEHFGKMVQKQPIEFVLCHSDIHGGNVIIANNGNIYIVDWNAPIMAPKERDLMFIGGGVGNVWNNSYEEKLFYNGYGKTDINKVAISYYRYERIVEDIADFCQSLLFATISEKEKNVMYKHFLDMFEPNGVVDIAFKTDPSNFS